MPAEALGEDPGIGPAAFDPVRQLAQLNAPDGRLHFEHAPVRPEGLVQPAKAGGVLAVVHGVVAFAVVLVGPGLLPHLSVVQRQQAALTAGRHDLVLTEGKGPRVPDAAYRTALVKCAMRLSAVLNHDQAMLAGQFHDWVHVAGPPSQVNGNDCAGLGGDQRPDGVRRDVLGNRVDLGNHGDAAAHHRGTGRGYERPGRGDDLVALTDAERVQSQLQRQRAVVKRNGVLDTQVLGVFALELPGFGAGPVVDLAGGQNLRDGLNFVRIENGPAWQ